MDTDTQTPTDAETVDQILTGYSHIKSELGKTIIGQEAVIDEILISLFAGGHVLITGAPGLAKTLLVKSIAEIFDLQFSRIQFTPDLMPADITGTEVLSETDAGRQLRFVPGPVFANIILADEINRTPPKTQAAHWRPCRSIKSLPPASAIRYPNPSSCSQRKTPLRWKAHTRCPRRSWIVSCSTWSLIIYPKIRK